MGIELVRNMDVKLADGRTVKIDSYYTTGTYAGMLEGLPTPETNASLIEQARRDLAKLWGKRSAVHVVRDDATPVTPKPGLSSDAIMRYPGAAKLGARMCWAWLTSYEPVRDKDACGSQLFLIWFETQDHALEPIPSQVAWAMDGVAWDQVAEDWDV